MFFFLSFSLEELFSFKKNHTNHTMDRINLFYSIGRWMPIKLYE